MNKTGMIIVSLLSCGLLLCACDYGGQGILDGGSDGNGGDDGSGGDQQQNVCEQAMEVQMQGVDEGCAGRSYVCCFCQCWNDGHKTYDSELYGQNQTCVCEEVQTNPQPCEGQTLTNAQACLADQDACRQQLKDMVLDPQMGWCTLTPL